jgi:hypothetical protein
MSDAQYNAFITGQVGIPPDMMSNRYCTRQAGPPAPAAPPAAAPAAVNVTQTQISTPTQSSGQSTDIGSSRPSETGVSGDVLTALVGLLSRPVESAAPASSSVTVATAPAVGPGFDLTAWASGNKNLLLLGGAAVLALLYWQTLPNKKGGKK